MHTTLIFSHVFFIMLAFGASPLGRLALRYLLTRVVDYKSAQAISRGFSGIFLIGGISITFGVSVGLLLAWPGTFTQLWVMASIVLIVIAGLGGVVIEDRWLKRLCDADVDTFPVVLNERAPFMAAIVSPVIWLSILWLMIAKPI